MLPSERLHELSKWYTEGQLRYQAHKWYYQTYFERLITPLDPTKDIEYLRPGVLYTYQYDPKYKEKLTFYDIMPLMLSLGPNKHGNHMGLNVSYIPPNVRIPILDTIYKTFQSEIDYNNDLLDKGRVTGQRPIPFLYETAEKLLEGSGWKFAIRSYIPKKVLNQPLIVSPAEWWRLKYYASDFIQNLVKNAIYYRYRKANDSNYKIGQ